MSIAVLALYVSTDQDNPYFSEILRLSTRRVLGDNKNIYPDGQPST